MSGGMCGLKDVLFAVGMNVDVVLLMVVIVALWIEGENRVEGVVFGEW